MKNRIETVAVIGAGAIGAYAIYGLSQQYKDRLWVLAEGKRADRLREEGLVINNVQYPLHVKSPEEARGVDLLLVCVKYGALREVLPMIRQAADEHTTVMSLLNGVDSEDILMEVLSEEQIIHALIRIASTHIGNQITFPLPKGNMGIIYGLPEKTGGTASASRIDRLARVKDCFDHSLLEHHVSEDIRRDIWMKYALNISQNIPQAILGAGVGVYGVSRHAAFMCGALREEVEKLAAAQGIDIRIPDDLVTPQKTGASKTARYSTLQDLDAGRPTEIDMFCGTAMKLAEKYQIPVPYNTFAYHIIKGLEEKNQGMFEFDSRELI